MEYEGQVVQEEPPRRTVKDVASSAFILLLVLWLLGMVVGFFFTADVTLTPANWTLWVEARLAVQVGLALLAAGAFVVANGRVAVAIAAVFVLFGCLLATNALRALGSGPTRIEGTVVSFHHGVFHSAFAQNGDRDFAVLALQRTPGKPYVLDLSGGPHAQDLTDLMKGCATPGDQLAITVLSALDAPLKVECLQAAR